MDIAEGVIPPADDLTLQHLAGCQLHQHITCFVAEVLLICNEDYILHTAVHRCALLVVIFVHFVVQTWILFFSHGTLE